jgi:hypothetical protein
MSFVSSLFLIFGGVLFLALVIISLGRLLFSRRKDKDQRQLPILADPTQYPWNARRGPWFFGNWGVNDKINAAISEGRRRQRYARGSQHRQTKRHKH